MMRAAGTTPRELDGAFSGVADSDGWALFVGYGSLLSKRSAKMTFPELRNFRVGKVHGYRRVFQHTAPVFFQRGIARLDTKEMSSVSCEPSQGSRVTVSLFEVLMSDQKAVEDFIEREHEYRFFAVDAYEMGGSLCRQPAVITVANDDETYRATRCPPEEFQRRYGQYGIEQVWRKDILPCRVYLRHCTLAAESLSPEAYESWLDDTFLADGKTSIRQYLEDHPEALEELPPPELETRYCGGQ